jgi:hypothetical protein
MLLKNSFSFAAKIQNSICIPDSQGFNVRGAACSTRSERTQLQSKWSLASGFCGEIYDTAKSGDLEKVKAVAGREASSENAGDI